MSKEVILDGTIAQVDWANPHIYLTLELDGPDGRRLQQVEVVSVAAARSGGLRREHLPIGSDVIVRAHPNRRGSEHTVLGSDVTLPDGTTYALNTTGRSSRPPAAAIAATDLSGSWAPRFDPLLVPLAHAWPLTEKARAALAETMSRPTPSDCAASPPPMLMQLPQLRTIEVGDDAVVISVDADGNSAVRTVHLGAAEHPEDVAPSLLGHSIGRWEGATLVIDTVGFEPHWTGIGFGVPSGAGKRLVERLTLAAGGTQLRYEFTIVDPEYLAAPATYAATWDHRPELEPSQLACDPEIARRFLEEASGVSTSRPHVETPPFRRRHAARPAGKS